MTIDEEVANLKTRLNAAQLAQLKAEAAQNSAQERLDMYLKQLREDFGVDNLGDARAKLEELQAELTIKLQAAKEILDSIED